MVTRRRLLSLALLWWSVCHAQDDGSCDTENGVCIPAGQSNDDDSCGLYLAPSTIPNGGLGVFTTRPLKKGSVVQPAGEVYVPVVDQDWHTGHKNIFWPMKDYYWMGDVMGMEQETDGDDVEAYCPGFDAMLNCNLALINVGKTVPTWDTAGLHRSKDPGAGAFTPYCNGTHPVILDVPVGAELFKFYGDEWFTGREEFGLIPLHGDYNRAEKLVKKFVKIALPSRVQESLWRLVVSKIPWESRTLNALPTAQDLDLVAAEGIRAIHYSFASRDLPFLKANGRCLDNILPGPSTIQQAGRGAFAYRFLAKDTIITGSPLLVVLDRAYLHKYGVKHENKRGQDVRDTHNLVGHQLLLNYCMGHHESNLLLCPYGTFVNYINHNQTQANVKIQWAPNGFIAQNNSYFDLKVSEMKGKFKTSLAIDYMALRDIQPGEELFLDYGDEFEDAWNRHVQNWKPPKNSNHYSDADTFNKVMKDTVLRTQQEQAVDPYPSNLEMRCHPRLKNSSWRGFLKKAGKDLAWRIENKGFPCDILSRTTRDDGSVVYDVRLEYEDEDDDENVITESVRRDGVPRSAISFVDKPYSTDIHMESAFRHEIGIPDDMFPERWKNREKKM